MNRQDFEKLLVPLVEIIDEIELDIIRNMLKRIDNYGDIKGTLEWFTDKLVELKILEKDNKEIFKGNKKKLKKIIEEIAQKSGQKIENLEKLNDYYETGKIEINPVNLYNSVSINKLIENAIKDTNDIMELIQTKALEGAKESYKKILNKAYIETAGGVYTYTESIKRAIDEFAEQGISAVHYANGRTLSIEAVARRDVITRMNKLVGDVEIEHAKVLNTNLVYVSQHLGARTRTKYTVNDYEAHDEWQGKKYMIEGSNDKYDNLYERTGYGEMLGLKGINCYHNMRPTFEWEEIDEVIDIEESRKVREVLDKRNYYARKLRTLKRKREAYKIINPEEVSSVNKKIKIVSEEYNNFLESNNLVRDYSREYVNNNVKKIYSYNDLTKQLLQNKDKIVPEERRLDYSFGSDYKKYYDYYYEDDKKLTDEIRVAKILESQTGHNIYLNPKTKTQYVKTPDYWDENTKELWDLKGLNGESANIIDNILNKACKKEQCYNLILEQRKTIYSTDYLKSKIDEIFDNGKRLKIKQVILLDKYGNIILYYKR